MLRWIASLFATLALSGFAHAAAPDLTFSYDGCVDAARKPVPAKADPELGRFAEAVLEDDNKLVIYYNPKALPQLLPETRLFLFAQECARFALKQPLGAERTPEQVQAADCWALDTLSRSRVLSKQNSINAVTLDLPIDSDAWAQIGSPARTLNLEACPQRRGRGNMALPGENAPHSDKWDACIHSCGARLYSCGRSASCQSTYDACSANCDKK